MSKEVRHLTNQAWQPLSYVEGWDYGREGSQAGDKCHPAARLPPKKATSTPAFMLALPVPVMPHSGGVDRTSLWGLGSEALGATGVTFLSLSL